MSNQNQEREKQALLQKIQREQFHIEILRQRVQTLQQRNWQDKEDEGRIRAENQVLIGMLEQYKQQAEMAIGGDTTAATVGGQAHAAPMDLEAATQNVPPQVAKNDTKKPPETALKSHDENLQVAEMPNTNETSSSAPPVEKATGSKSQAATAVTQVKKIKLWSHATHHVYQCPVRDCQRQIPFCKDASPPLTWTGMVSDQVVWDHQRFASQIETARKHMRNKHKAVDAQFWPPAFRMRPGETTTTAPTAVSNSSHGQATAAAPQPTITRKVLSKYPLQN